MAVTIPVPLRYDGESVVVENVVVADDGSYHVVLSATVPVGETWRIFKWTTHGQGSADLRLIINGTDVATGHISEVGEPFDSNIINAPFKAEEGDVVEIQAVICDPDFPLASGLFDATLFYFKDCA